MMTRITSRECSLKNLKGVTVSHEQNQTTDIASIFYGLASDAQVEFFHETRRSSQHRSHTFNPKRGVACVLDVQIPHFLVIFVAFSVQISKPTFAQTHVNVEPMFYARFCQVL